MTATCHYCGDQTDKPHQDHFIPRSRGGSDSRRNLVTACNPCNSTKGSRLFADARTALILRRLKWPRFSEEQLQWLESQNFDTGPVRNGKLYFEEQKK